MGLRAPIRIEPWRSVADLQDGIISRSQLLAAGLSPGEARRNVDNGRWRRLLPGIYATFTGPVGATARVWSAILYSGTGAAASHRTALWLGGILDEAVDPIHVSIPASRRVLRQPGIRIHLNRALDDPGQAILHPSAAPPRVRLEVALLDQCDVENAGQAVHLVLSAIQRRLTTADRIGKALAARPRHRYRSLIIEMLAEASDGVASALELRYRRDVERAHGLPAGIRNQGEAGPGNQRRYRDVRYPRWGVIVELDGREAHPPESAFRDMRRDNGTVVNGDRSLRYGWRDVVGDRCSVTLQVSIVLSLGGWPGRPERCGPTCRVGMRA